RVRPVCRKRIVAEWGDRRRRSIGDRQHNYLVAAAKFIFLPRTGARVFRWLRQSAAIHPCPCSPERSNDLGIRSGSNAFPRWPVFWCCRNTFRRADAAYRSHDALRRGREGERLRELVLSGTIATRHLTSGGAARRRLGSN